MEERETRYVETPAVVREEPVVREQQVVREERVVREPDESTDLVGYAAIKWTAIVVIVLAVLAFLAWYVAPRIG